jgi:hypothetical protein
VSLLGTLAPLIHTQDPLSLGVRGEGLVEPLLAMCERVASPNTIAQRSKDGEQSLLWIPFGHRLLVPVLAVFSRSALRFRMKRD